MSRIGLGVLLGAGGCAPTSRYTGRTFTYRVKNDTKGVGDVPGH